MPKQSNIERWRMMAGRARTRADGMTDPASKRAMLEIAAAYEALAQRAEEIAARERPSGPDQQNPA
jgi:hypothetical protein